jgi:hypothetical protein
MLQSLCPKWVGSWELLHDFARESVASAPPGGAHGSLIVQAHLEHGLDEASTAPNGWAGLKNYFSRPSVKDEIHQAAERSIRHPGFTRGGYRWLSALNEFAVAFRLIGDREAAAFAFERMDGLATEDPWDYLGDAATEFRKARNWALGGSK